ncbi:MAG: VWA domain-containing protein [Phycisphaerales bacterium]
MNRIFDWIFGFDAGTFGAQDSGIGFAHSIPIWIWMPICLVIGLSVWLSYKGLPGPRWFRVSLGSIRWGVVVLLLVLALGPQIERERTLIERDRVIVLLDASGSMRMPELASDGTLTTRARMLSDLLAQSSTIFEQIESNSFLDVYTFTDRISDVDGFPSIDSDSISDSASTTLGRSLQSAISNAGTSPISGIVVFSDGQSHDQPSDALLESLMSFSVPVITVPIGSSAPVRDASIRLVESPNAVFAKDRVPVRVVAQANGYKPGDEINIELVDQTTGITLDSSTQTVPDVTDEHVAIEADLSHTFADAGEKRVFVRLTPNSGTDLINDNNQQSIELSVISEPMRVLYIDGHPRWEYRYLKNILTREDTISATTMLLASDRRFIEEGQSVNGQIPSTYEEWEPFDVVMLGDVSPELFSESQLASLKEHIESRGCGLLWIAGEGSTPNAWLASQLAPLLPMQRGKADSLSTSSNESIQAVMKLTEFANRVGLLASSDRTQGSRSAVENPDAGWTILRWVHTIGVDDLKPGVSTLAFADSLDQQSERALVTTMRYGGGQAGYVGTDEIWRWRYGLGENLPEQFWLPMIRTLARGTIARRAAPAGISVSPQRIAPGDDLRITLDLFDSSIIEDFPMKIQSSIKPLSQNLSETNIQLNGNGKRRSAIWTPIEPGLYSISVSHPLLGVDPVSQTFRVLASWDESTNPNTAHDALATLSEQTQGDMLNPDQLSNLPDLLPNRTRITTLPPQTTPLWDRPIVLILLVLLLTTEWIGRRAIRLA